MKVAASSTLLRSETTALAGNALKDAKGLVSQQRYRATPSPHSLHIVLPQQIRLAVRKYLRATAKTAKTPILKPQNIDCIKTTTKERPTLRNYT